jgi:hypothetical protein
MLASLDHPGNQERFPFPKQGRLHDPDGSVSQRGALFFLDAASIQ